VTMKTLIPDANTLMGAKFWAGKENEP
jgi:hypothetical protein